MSNRNFDFSAVASIRKAQNAANYYNRQQAVNQGQTGIPYTGELLAVNPQSGNYDADTISTIRSGQQAYYLKGFPDTTVLSPQVFIPPSPSVPYVYSQAKSAIQDFFTTSSDTSIQAYIDTYGPTTSLIEFRSVLKDTPSLAQRGAALASVLTALNGGTTAVIPVTSPAEIQSIIGTFDTISDFNPPDPTKPVYVVAPAFVAGVATIDLSVATYNGSTYADIIQSNTTTLVFELPVSVTNEYQLTLTYNGSSMTLIYNGTSLIDIGVSPPTSYSATDILNIGGLFIPLAGLGSFGIYSGMYIPDPDYNAPTITSITAGSDSTIEIIFEPGIASYGGYNYFLVYSNYQLISKIERINIPFWLVHYHQYYKITLNMPPCRPFKIFLRGMVQTDQAKDNVPFNNASKVFLSSISNMVLINTVLLPAPVITGVEINYSTITINFTCNRGCENNASIDYRIRGSLDYSNFPIRHLSISDTSGSYIFDNTFTESVQIQLLMTTDVESSPPSIVDVIPNPIITSLVPGINSLTVHFTVPTIPYPYTKYTFYCSNAGNVITNVSTDVSGTSFTIPSLDQVQSYTVTMQATYRFLIEDINSPLSNPMAAIPLQLPTAPTLDRATTTNETVTIYFTPGYKGSGNYEFASWTKDGVNYHPFSYTSNNSGSYTFPYTVPNDLLHLQLTMTTDVGSSPPSNIVNLTTLVPPGPPTITGIAARNQSLTITYVAGTAGTNPITNYKYTLFDTSSVVITSAFFSPSQNGASGSYTITGLTNTQPYTVGLQSVTINNTSSLSNLVSGTPSSTFIPGPPTITDIVAGDQSLTITYVAGAAGSSPITNYQYTLSINSVNLETVLFSPPQNGASGSYTITGLNNLYNDQYYTIGLQTVTIDGTSVLSNQVNGTPTAMGSPTNFTAYYDEKTLTNIVLSFSAPTNTGNGTISYYGVTVTDFSNNPLISTTQIRSSPYSLFFINNRTHKDIQVCIYAVNTANEKSSTVILRQHVAAYTSPNTYSLTIPNGVQKVYGFLVGGGGGGGQGTVGQSGFSVVYTGAGGGGSAGHVLADTLDISGSTNLSIQVGQGGAGGSSNLTIPAGGVAGQDTFIGYDTHSLIAQGGLGGSEYGKGYAGYGAIPPSVASSGGGNGLYGGGGGGG